MSADTCPASPPGYFYRDDCTLLCQRAAWSDVLVFFLGNYVAHIATVVSQPGQSLASSILFPLLALIFPGTGIARGLRAIFSMAIFAPTELQMAARAGALCTVAPIKTVVREGIPNIVEVPDYEHPRFLSPTVHGVYRLPKGYCFVRLDKRARFVNDPEDEPVSFGKRILGFFTAPFQPRRTHRVTIAYNYNAAKIIVAVVQLAFAVVTLYHARGDQIAMYGFAAFGLTVVQYAWMSLVNLLGSLLCPNYPSIFVVESETLRRLRKEINDANKTDLYPLSGTVGELTEDTEKEILKSPNHMWNTSGLNTLVITLVGGTTFGFVPVAIIMGLTKGARGGSALYQQVWTMAWLAMGFLIGAAWTALLGMLLNTAALSQRVMTTDKDDRWALYGMIMGLLGGIAVFTTPAIGGFVVVAQMIFEYGQCTRLSQVSV